MSIKKIFISEEIPSLNKGEAALLYGAIESFKNLGDIVEVSLLSFHAEIDKPRYFRNAKLIDGTRDLYLLNNFDKLTFIRLVGSIFVLIQFIIFAILYKMVGLNSMYFMKKEIWKEYCTSDLIIIGHDSAFSGMFGTVPFFQLYSLFIAKIIGKPIAIYAASAGPFKYKLQLIIAKFILNNVDIITLRDSESYDYLKTIGIKMEHVHLCADLAYLMPVVPSNRVNEILSDENIGQSSGLVVGMTVTREICNMAFNDVGTDQDKFQKSIILLSQVVDYMTNVLNATVILIPHCIGPGEKLDDRIVSHYIYEAVNNKSNVKVISNEYSPQELKGLMSQFDLFIGERLHSVVGALSVCVPSIAILYKSPRNELISGVLDTKYILDVEVINKELLISKINDVLSESEGIKQGLITRIKNAKLKASKNGELLKNILRSDY